MQQQNLIFSFLTLVENKDNHQNTHLITLLTDIYLKPPQ